MKKYLKWILIAVDILLILAYFGAWAIDKKWTGAIYCIFCLLNMAYEYLVYLFTDRRTMFATVAVMLCIAFFGYSLFVQGKHLLYQYGSFVEPGELKQMITNVEKQSLTKDFLRNMDYHNAKYKLLDKQFPTKADLKAFLKTVAASSADKNMKYTWAASASEEQYVTRRRSSIPMYIPTYHSSYRILNYGGNKVPYIRIYDFKGQLANELKEGMKQFGNPRLLILDLRCNLGGSGTVLLDAADVFLPKATELMSAVEDGIETTWYAKQSDEFLGDLLVLVDEDTASSAEAMAMILKHARPEKVHLLGSETFGKSVGQVTYTFEESDIRLAIVNSRWNVAGRTTEDLQQMLAESSLGFKYESVDDYSRGIRLYVNKLLGKSQPWQSAMAPSE